MQSELQKQAEHLLNVFQHQNNETQEFATLLAELADYEWCMSDTLKDAISEEMSALIDFEYQWDERED